MNDHLSTTAKNSAAITEYSGMVRRWINSMNQFMEESAFHGSVPIFLLLLLLFAGSSLAQERRFFMPSEIAKAYEKGTRSFDGKPGPNYWQNTVDYSMEVTVFPAEKLLNGKVKAVYHNESPDELKTLVVRLYADAYKKGNERLRNIDQRDIHEGVEIDSIKIDGTAVVGRRRVTNMIITLEQPLPPGEELTFEAIWKQKIPEFTRERLGAYDSASFFVAYWYPQIAVYDDIFGWDMLDYNLQAEFYNNLGNFDVKINAPEEFLVWATGTLQNAENIFPSTLYDRYQKASSSGDIVSIVTDKDLQQGIRLLSGSWHYTASGVSDFAFGISDHHRWDAVMQRFGDRQVLINSVYPNDTARRYSEHISMQQKAMQYLSNDIPGVTYPYEAFTTYITGEMGGGMEYPMMANNGGPGRGVTIHEMFHTYFPMYVRINERRWAWMDEGWANFNTSIVTRHYFEDNYNIAELFARSNPASSGIMGTVRDLPLITSTQFLSGENYGYASYPLPAFLYTILYHELGEELFLKCYREYINRWAKKSPTPYDFFYTFENVSGRDLSWFWKPWFFEFGYPDVGIESVEGSKLIVARLGNKPVPLIAEFTYENGDTKTVDKGAGIWANGVTTYQMEIPDADRLKTVTVNATVADRDLADNVYPSIKSLYKNVDLSASLLGQYRMMEYGFTFDLVMEDDILYLRTGWGMSRILYPKDEFDFVSIDKSLELTFSQDDSGAFNEMEINWFGTQSKIKKL